jgi:hypothetical protein
MMRRYPLSWGGGAARRLLIVHLENEVVFVGGQMVPLFITDRGLHRMRPTDDVDVVVECRTRRAYHAVPTATARGRRGSARASCRGSARPQS